MRNWMLWAKERSRALAGDMRGATMVEYIVIISLIFLVAVGAWRALGKKVNEKTQAAVTELGTP
jgi:Flp pilus assembly pilin Flp